MKGSGEWWSQKSGMSSGEVRGEWGEVVRRDEAMRGC